jgi:Zn-dependent peptidase ImmA (M78 family)
MNNRQALAKSAAIRALRIRASVHAKPWDAIDVFDLAQQLGVEVRFAKISSMDGMYLRQDAPVIVIASERPAGRQRFSCAHELGHHAFGDGTRVDELLDPNSGKDRQDDEVRADMFAGMLLMPKSAVDRAFSVRNLNPITANPVEFYRIACSLGVGYSTLAGHLHYALRTITQDRFAYIHRFTPKAIRESVLNQTTPEELIIVDEQWSSRPVDAAVGDFLLLPPGTSVEGPFCEKRADLQYGVLFQAVTPGVGRFESSSGWATFVRVSRKYYEGRSMFRHLEEVEYD